MQRRTKIICTLGPASSDRNTIGGLIAAGMDVARVNFSHGTHDDHRRVINLVREEAGEAGRVVPILQDLQGPKIRVGLMKDGGVPIRKGERLILTADDIEYGNRTRVSVSYPSLAEDVSEGGTILIDDGTLELRVLEARNGDVVTEVVTGGLLKSRKGVNLPDIKTSTPALTEKDLADLAFGLEIGVDLIALSFVRHESDVADLCDRVHEAGKNISVIAKIEKPEAVTRVEKILDYADGLMVARGDLGIEMRMSQVPKAQKTIIRQCLAAAKPVITATQMLESMIENPRPTRAEASDVANAVLDGSDAVMLSGETAVGHDPVRVVEVMSRIVEEAEDYRQTYDPGLQHYHEADMTESEEITWSISYTACQLAEQVGAAAIACLTASGSTARSIARHRPSMPLYAFTDNEAIVGQLGLVWGTKTFHIPFQRDTDEGVSIVHRILLTHGYVQPGDLVVITAGMPLPAKGRTNMVHVSRV